MPADIDRKSLNLKAIDAKSNFEVDPLDALGLYREDARDTLYQFARRKPTEYSQWRQETIRNIVHKACKEQYALIMNLLTKGYVGTERLKVDGEEWNPSIPEQEGAEIAANCAASMVKVMKNELNKIMPPDFETLANDRVHLISRQMENEEK